ncbi:MAG: hypothetical protein C4526_07165 [Nitrospiraceae bacterium]|nr:MAG: hypothetical protein C4526_07165 [Nitrospiraceae bacterium]
MEKKFKSLIEFIVRHLATDRPLIIVLILAAVTLAIFTGSRYYSFTKNDPQFCELCHLMKESYKSWENSSHRNAKCQTCHSMSLLGQNRLLFSYIFSGNKSAVAQEHGRVTPWESCKTCHMESVRQGGVTMRKSYGHARHVFMEKIECNKCHEAEMHNFPPDERNCLTCHEDKGVHGMGMESFACLSCHAYGEVTAMPTKQKCLNCHKEIPQKGPMSGLDCRKCHKPHSRIKPQANDCMINCHTNQHSIGRHDRHRDISCLDCHKAHSWKVGREQAKTLCVKCHDYKDPVSFIF